MTADDVHVEPLTRIALGITAKPNLYAILLGSGISSAAGIPTGYDVTLALIRRLAVAEGIEPEEPFSWYRSKFGQAADYSGVLQALATTPVERQALLRPFFEPSADDLASGLKEPTDAHRAIARIMRRGLVKVVITTNFDRLLERALEDAGLSPIVLSTDAAIASAQPFEHLSHVIIKTNGDYLDTRIRNTTGELSAYPKATARVLDAIIDNYGLVVCGWSAKYDLALRAILEGRKTRRYALYWMTRGKPDPEASVIISLLDAVETKVSSANEAFRLIDERCNAIEREMQKDSITPHLAASMVKGWMQNPEHHRIELHDLLFSQTDRVIDHFRVPLLDEGSPVPSQETMNARLRSIEIIMETLMRVGLVLGGWGRESESLLLHRAVQRLIVETRSHRPGRHYDLWVVLSRYPAALLWNSVLIGAYFEHNTRMLSGMFNMKLEEREGLRDQAAIERLTFYSVLSSTRKWIAGHEQKYFGESFHLRDVFGPLVQQELYADTSADTFNSIEYLQVLIGTWNEYGAEAERPLLINEGSRNRSPARRLIRELSRAGQSAVTLRAGYFSGDVHVAHGFITRLESILDGIQEARED
jgi:hypothetical protein